MQVLGSKRQKSLKSDPTLTNMSILVNLLQLPLAYVVH